MQLQKFPAIPLTALALTLIPAGLVAETATLAPSADTSIFEFSPLNNLGGLLTLAVGETGSHGPARALIKFDVTNSVPVGAQVVRANLQITVVKAPFLPEPSTFSLYRVLADWGEGNKGMGLSTGNGAIASMGEATWRARMHPTNLWSSAGLEAGTDHVATASASVEIAEIGTYVFNSTPELVTDVQTWLDSSTANFGWLLKSDGEGVSSTARRVGSREDSANAAQLEIEYILSPPPHIPGVQQDGREFHLGFLAQAGFTYTVEYRPAANAGLWTPLTNITAKLTDFEALAIDSVDASPQRFYRLSRVPCNCD